MVSNSHIQVSSYEYRSIVDIGNKLDVLEDRLEAPVETTPLTIPNAVSNTSRSHKALIRNFLVQLPSC